jgi:hypothetical protein
MNINININTDERYTETEITINCNRISDDIDKLLAAIRLLDMKLTGRKDGRQFILEASVVIYILTVLINIHFFTLQIVYMKAPKIIRT